MDVCWTDVKCNRALVVSHGGDWNLARPYDSMQAMVKAYTDGTDAVKGDFRVSADNVGMVTHSSPIQWYESPDCAGKKIEDMNASQITQCKMALTSDHFITAPELLKWSDGKVIVMFCVKDSKDIPRAISTLIENNATHRAFLEIRVGNMVNIVPTTPGWDKVWYLAEGGSAQDIDTLLASKVASRSWAFEFDPDWEKWGINVTDAIVNKLHPAGVRSLAATTRVRPSEKQQVELFDDGFDVVYTYDTVHAVEARTKIDKQRGVTPA